MFVVSANFKISPWSLLTQMSDVATEVAQESAQNLDGLVALSTCNRVEFYGESANDLQAIRAITTLCAEKLNVEPETLFNQLLVLRDVEAIEHLTRTTCGLEAIAVGENEIGGQVRRAYTNAIRENRVTSSMRRIFDHALRVNKDLRKIDELPKNDLLTIALQKIDGESAIESALVIGTGEYARVVHELLHLRGVRNHFNYSTSGRRITLPFSAQKVKPQELISIMEKVDVVIAATGADTPVISQQHVENLAKIPMFLDLTLGEDIAVDVSEVATVVRLEDLATASSHEATTAADHYVRTQAQLLAHKMNTVFQPHSRAERHSA